MTTLGRLHDGRHLCAVHRVYVRVHLAQNLQDMVVTGSGGERHGRIAGEMVRRVEVCTVYKRS